MKRFMVILFSLFLVLSFVACSEDDPATINYTVTFDSQSADTLASPTNRVIADGETLVSLPSDPIKANYAFGGWFTEVSGGGTEFTTSTVVTGDITVYAKWIVAFTVNYDSQGADTVASPTNMSVVDGETATALPNAPVKTGYLFGGWFTEVSGGGTVFTASTVVTSDITVYAKWLDLYTVTYNDNSSAGGTVPTDSISYTNGQIVTVVGNTGSLMKTDFYFVGWTNSSGIIYTNNSVFIMGSENAVLYAKWNRLYDLRDVGPAGGSVFYDKGSYSDGWRYLEAAPSDQSSGIRWYNGSYIDIGTTSSAIGAGQINTTNIIAVQGVVSYAAQLCNDLEYGGYDDWFLPSKDELNKIYLNLYSESDENNVTYSRDSSLATGGYWSSTEAGEKFAWGHNFGVNNQYVSFKNETDSVRAVRAF